METHKIARADDTSTCKGHDGMSFPQHLSQTVLTLPNVKFVLFRYTSADISNIWTGKTHFMYCEDIHSDTLLYTSLGYWWVEIRNRGDTKLVGSCRKWAVGGPRMPPPRRGEFGRAGVGGGRRRWSENKIRNGRRGVILRVRGRRGGDEIISWPSNSVDALETLHHIVVTW